MKKQRDFAGNIFGLLAMALFALALLLLFGMWGVPQRIAGASEPTPTVDTTSPSPTETPTVEALPVFKAENLRVVKETRITQEHSSVARAWSPDSTQLIFTQSIKDFPSQQVLRIELWIAKVKEGTLRRVTDNGRYPSWSPDGKKIAYSSEVDGARGVWVMTADGREQRKLADTDSMFVSWKGDNEVVFFDKNNHLVLIDIESEVYQAETVAEGYPGLDEAAKWRTIRLSPDGTKFAYKYDESRRMRIVNIVAGEQVELVAEQYFAFGLMAWSPDGRRLAYDSHYGPQPSLWVVNADGTEKRKILQWPREPRGSFEDIVWSPDGNVLAFTYRPTGTYPTVGVCTVYVINVDGTGLRPLEGLDDIVQGTFLWSPDGAKMAFSREEKPDNFYLWVADIER